MPARRRPVVDPEASKAASDVHIAIVSSSLGGHGNPDFCEDTNEKNDFAHLISAERRPGAEGVDNGYQGFGFLDR